MHKQKKKKKEREREREEGERGGEEGGGYPA